MVETLLGAVEAGGTKFNCAIGTREGRLLEETRLETAGPEETLERVLDFFETAGGGRVAAFGIGSFGPVHLDRSSPDWGRLSNTPKPGWANTDIAGPFIRRFGKAVAIDTDVNAAALGESIWGAGKGCQTMVYLTIGTGVGGGAIVNGRPLRSAGHPEMGHIALPRHPDDEDFPGSCPFHGDCAEGLISGPSIERRFGRTFSQLEADHPFRLALAHYIGELCKTCLLMLAPQRIVLGGGVMEGSLYAPASEALRRSLNGYLDLPEVANGSLVVPPGLGSRSGVMGALALAREALDG